MTTSPLHTFKEIQGLQDLKISIVSHTSKSDKEWSKICINSQREYAEKHGIEYHLYEDVNTLGRDAAWSRFRVLHGRATGGRNGEIVIWMDSDLMIMNPDFNIMMLVDQFASDPAGFCHFPLGGTLDLGLVMMKAHPLLREIFEIGWSVGSVEAHGSRRDKLSIELMNFLQPKTFKAASAKDILSSWYPPSPKNFFNQQIDSAEGSLGMFWMKRPKEMTNNFPDLYVPGCFAVHLHQKGRRLLDTSAEFLEYRESLIEGVIEAQKLVTDL
jgi:hypothetical protein